MRRLYMQKEKDTGTRGMVATGWLCEGCNFSDIITQFEQSRPKPAHQHSALICECQMCGTNHKKGMGHLTKEVLDKIDLKHILKKLGDPQKRIDGLILINNLDDPSEYLGLVLGIFIWSDAGRDTHLIAKNVFTTHATALQREIIDSVWRKSWKRKGWVPLQSERFMKKIIESSTNLDQIFGIGVIMNRRITESTFKAIGMMKAPEIYVDVALESNHRLADEYVKMAMSEGNSKLVEKYTALAIKGGNYELLGKYVEIKGQDAAELIIEQLDKRKSQLDYWELGNFHEALARTGAPEAALELIKVEFKYSYKRHLTQMGNKNSENPIIRALADLPNNDVTNTELVSMLVSHLDDYEPIEFLTQYYREPQEAARLFSEVITSSGDYEKTRRFLREAAGISSSQYKNYLLKKDPEGIMKFLFSDDPVLRLKGTSMGKTADLGEELKEFIFVMSFLDPGKSVREGATELVKEIGSSEITTVLDQDGFLIFDYWDEVAHTDLTNNLETLERLIDYKDPRFLPIILEHLRPRLNEFKELNGKVNSLLKSLGLSKEQRVDMLLEMAMTEAERRAIISMVGELLLVENQVVQRQDILSSTALINNSLVLARNAVTCALTIDKTRTTEFIRENMNMITGEERAKRKEAVNRRLMFIDIFAEIATSSDLPYIQNQMKKDRSPRVKRKFAEIIMAVST